MGLFKKLKKIFKNPGKALKKAANPKNIVNATKPGTITRGLPTPPGLGRLPTPPVPGFLPIPGFPGNGKKPTGQGKVYTLDEIEKQGGLFSGETGRAYAARQMANKMGRRFQITPAFPASKPPPKPVGRGKYAK